MRNLEWKKVFLSTASCGLVSLPIAALVACGSVWGNEQDPNLEKDQPDKEHVKLESFYQTSLADHDTFGFQIGHTYSASQLGIEKIPNDQYLFEIEDYDDLQGTISVSISHVQNQAIQRLKTGVRIEGFKSLNFKQFLAKVTQDIPKDKVLASDLLLKPKPSELKDMTLLNVDTLGIAGYFKLRKAENFVSVVGHDDLVGELVIDLKIAIDNQADTVRLTITDLEMEDSVLKQRLEKIRQIIDKLDENLTTARGEQLPSALAQRKSDQNFWDQLGVGSFPEIDDQNIKVSFDIGPNTSDDKGQLELIITFETTHQANSIKRSKIVTINGFLTSEQAKHDKDHVKAQVVKNWFEKLNKRTSLTTLLPTQVKKMFLADQSKHNLSTLGLPEIPSLLKKDVEVKLTPGLANDEQGTLALLVKIEAGNARLEISLTIEGFITTQQIREREHQKNQQDLIELLDYIEKNNRTRFNKKLPTQVTADGEEVDFQKIGLDNLDQDVLLGAEVKLVVIHAKDETGEIELEVRVTKGQASDSRTIVIQGFQTSDQITQERQKKILQQLEDFLDWASSNWSVSKHKNLRPTQIGKSQTNVSQEKLGLEKKPDQKWADISSEFTIVNPDDFNGTIEVELTVTKLDQTARRTFLISGYKTHQKTIDELLAWLKDRRNKTRLDQELPSQIYHQQGRRSFANLGLDDLPTDLFGDYQVKLELTDFNDDYGWLEVKLSVSKDDLTQSLTYRVFGYKTKNKVFNWLKEKLNWIRNERARTIHRDKLASLIGSKDQLISLKELGLSDLDLLDRDKVSWKLIFIGSNDLKGEATILVKLSYQGVVHSEHVTVGGFLTTKEELKKLLERIKSDHLTTSLSDRLPSSIGTVDQWVTFENLGLEKWANFEEKHGVKIKLTIVSPNDKDGTLLVRAVVNKSSANEEAILTVRGFKKIDEQIQEITSWKNKLTNWLEVNWSNTSLKDRLPSQIAQPGQEKSFAELGVPQIPTEFENIFKLIVKVDQVKDSEGQLALNIKIQHPDRNFDFKLVVKGFKTSEQVKAELQVCFDWISKNRDLTSHGKTLPSRLFESGQKVSFKQLGMSDLAREVSLGINVELVVEETIDASGQVKVKVLLSKTGVSEVFYYTVRGFKKLSEYFAELVSLIKQQLSKIDFSDRLPSQLGKVGTTLEFHQLGLPGLDPDQWSHTNVEIVVAKDNDQSGELTITIKINRLGETHEENLTLRNFLNKLTFDQRAVDKLVAEIKDLHGSDQSSSKIVVKIGSSSHLYEIEISKISSDMIKNDLRAWGIFLPTNLDTFGLDWKIVSIEENLNMVVLRLQIVRDQAKSEIIFHITGFKPYTDKLVDAKLKSIPDQFETKLTKTLVSKFPLKKELPLADFGVEISGVETKHLELKATVVDNDDRLGKLVVLLSVTSLKTGYTQSKNLIIIGYWNDAKRELAKQDIPKEIDRIFGKNYFDGKLADLSELELEQIVPYDSTTIGNKWIGDDERYKKGQTLTLEDLKLLTETPNLIKMLEKLGESAVTHLAFEVVERPSGGNFTGWVSVRPILRYVDLEFSSKKPILIDGFQNFENYIHYHVRKLKTSLSSQIEQGYRGLLVSLFKEWLGNSDSSYDGQISNYPRWQDGKGRSAQSINKFLELTKLAGTFTYRIDGKYDLFVVDILGQAVQEDDRQVYDLAAHDFEFLFGVKGQDVFNQKIYQGESFYDRLYRGKRSFAKKLTGFATRDDVVKTVERTYAALDNSLTLKAPNLHLSHFRGILQSWYGDESLPEFPYDFGDSPNYRSKRKLLSDLLTPGDLKYEARINYTQPDDVDKWLKVIGLGQRYYHWKMMPADWNKVFELVNADSKHQSENMRFYSAQPYFRFMSVDDLESDQPTMNFSVAFLFRAYEGTATAYNGESPEESIELEKLEKHSLVVRLKMDRSLIGYLHQLFSQSGLEGQLFNSTVKDKLNARLVDSDSRRHKIEVKIAYAYERKGNDDFSDYATNKYARENMRRFYWDEQINYSPGTFSYGHVRNRPENSDGVHDPHLIHDVFASWRLKHWQISQYKERKYPSHISRHEIDFEKLLGNLGVTIFLEKLEATDLNDEIWPDKFTKKVNVNVRFQPWLLYNNHIYIGVGRPRDNYKPVTYVNRSIEPWIVKTNWVWDIDYQFYNQSIGFEFDKKN